MAPPYWPRPNRFLEALRGGRPPIVMWMTLESTSVIEMAAAHGLDTVIIDLEHTTASLRDAHAMIVAAQGAGMSALVRPSSIDSHDVGRLLDAGADGMVFAQVKNKSDAEAAARSLRYPPEGTRGWAGNHARHVRWNHTLPGEGEHPLFSAEFVKAANESIASVFMIESGEGVENLEEILEVGRPDAVFFGWQDFGVGVGFDAEAGAAARDRVYNSCRARGIGIALNVSPRGQLEYYPGCFYAAGVDSSVASAAIGVRMQEANSAIADALSL
jgi:4-hydroxy-2-oxoheptanedioate aldolase